MRKIHKSKLFIFSLIITLLMPLFQSNIYAIQGYPYITGKSGIALEYNTGKILYEQNMNDAVYPASTTKLLTTLIAKEKLGLSDIITAPDNFTKVVGSTINIVPGESFTVEQLINATLIRSANDAATLLAINISGSVEEFATLMNSTAKDLGCTNSNFVNPSGLHYDNHYTTASDMSKIALAFISNPVLKNISSQKQYTIPATNKKAERILTNSNRFISGDKYQGENFLIENNGSNIPVGYDIVDGIKTGTTPKAGNCLVSTAQKGNMRVIALVFGSTERGVYSDSRYLLDYSFDNYKRTEIIASNAVIKTYKKPFSQPKTVDFKIGAGFSYVEPITETAEVTGNAKFSKIKTPITAGQQVGVYSVENKTTKQVLAELPIYASSSYESTLSWNYLGKSTFGKIFRVVFLILILAIALFTTAYAIRQRNIKKKREERRLKRLKEREKWQ